MLSLFIFYSSEHFGATKNLILISAESNVIISGFVSSKYKCIDG